MKHGVNMSDEYLLRKELQLLLESHNPEQTAKFRRSFKSINPWVVDAWTLSQSKLDAAIEHARKVMEHEL